MEVTTDSNVNPLRTTDLKRVKACEYPATKAGRAVLSNGHDYFTYLTICFHIALRICNIFEPEGFINYRFQFAGTQAFCDEGFRTRHFSGSVVISNSS